MSTFRVYVAGTCTSAMDYFGLIKDFRHAGFFETSYHKRLFQEIKTAIISGNLIALTGVVGSGKTVLLRRFQHYLKDSRIIVSKSQMVEKEKVNLASLIAALYYDLTLKTDTIIPASGEKRERELQVLIKTRRKPVVLLVDEAHDLNEKALCEIKRLLEVIQESGCTLSVLLAGHPKLKNVLNRPTMKEIGYRSKPFTLDPSEFSRKEFIEWLLDECSQPDIKPADIMEPEAIDLLSEKLSTPLQIIQHLTASLEASHQADEKPVSVNMVQSVISDTLYDWEVTLTRHGYNSRNLAQLLDTKPAEIKALFKGDLDASRTRELQEELMVVGLPVK